MRTAGWDHGVFIPMILIHPTASIPIVQLSVLSSESPSAHYRLGRALSGLRSHNIAIVGSGFASFHNIPHVFSGVTRSPPFKKLNDEWNALVSDAVTTENVEERGQKLEGWRSWKGAWDMHPRGGADHFMPLLVCAGAAGEEKAKAYSDEQFGLNIWSFYWD
jgi:aromatic ring-opening dioxygenase catalytic subunit (LigB family)